MSDGLFVQQIVDSANRACTLCHGRGIIANSGREYMGMYGSERAYQDWYEEYLCECVQSGELTCMGEGLCHWPHPTFNDRYEAFMEEALLGWTSPPYNLRDATHWGCPQCALEVEREKRADDAQALYYAVGELELEIGNHAALERFRKAIGL